MDRYTYKWTCGGVSIIKWPSCRWDYENAMFNHNLISAPSIKLWPKPYSFVLDGTDYMVCLNGFGPKGRFYLWSCKHIYQPMSLIFLIVVCRCYVVCKAPFYQRLYELFGLASYMPISWECTLENICNLRKRWSNNLACNWLVGNYSFYKSILNS